LSSTERRFIMRFVKHLFRSTVVLSLPSPWSLAEATA